jgi:hypothetical protein
MIVINFSQSSNYGQHYTKAEFSANFIERERFIVTDSGAKKATLSVNLTEHEAGALRKISEETWDIPVTVVVRRLILSFINDRITLLEVIPKIGLIDPERGEDLRICRVTVRMRNGEKERLREKGKECLLQPGGVVRVLILALLVGLIDRKDLWD